MIEIKVLIDRPQDKNKKKDKNTDNPINQDKIQYSFDNRHKDRDRKTRAGPISQLLTPIPKLRQILSNQK